MWVYRSSDLYREMCCYSRDGKIRQRSDSDRESRDSNRDRAGTTRSDRDMMARDPSKETDREADDWDRERERPPFDRQRVRISLSLLTTTFRCNHHFLNNKLMNNTRCAQSCKKN
jgi:hypothetical protein